MECKLADSIYSIVKEEYPDKPIKDVIDKGVWFKHIFKVIFSDNSAVYVKLGVNKESSIAMEANVISLLHENGIQQPVIVHIDSSLTRIPYEYDIYEDVCGVPLAKYLPDGDKHKLTDIYTAIGRYYRKYAEISGPFAGVWDIVPGKSKYPVHPADAMFELEVAGGSGKALLDKGAISRKQYDNIVSIWRSYIPGIKALPVHLTHFSPFPWAIYLGKSSTGFYVSKITALSDILWWNEHATIAHILHPPFFDISDELRQAFMYGYDRAVNPGIINCFLLHYRLCAINGTYMQPACCESSGWKAKALEEIDTVIKRLSENNY